MVEKRVNKALYRFELLLIKIVPLLIAGCYLLNSVLSYLQVNTLILSLIGGMSLLPMIFLYISSFVFKFCIYHRLPLYYVFIVDGLNYYDIYFGVPVDDRGLMLINVILFGVLVSAMAIIKFILWKKELQN